MEKCPKCGSIVRRASEKGCEHCLNEFLCQSCRKKYPTSQESKEFRVNCLVCAKKLKSSDRLGTVVNRFIGNQHGVEVKVPEDSQLVRVVKKGKFPDVTTIQTK
jgi:hypothetical protein